jgi:outer membrane protein TolC
MKAWRIFVTAFVVFGLLSAPSTAQAQNFVQEFLNRYRPPRIDAPLSVATQSQLADLIRTGQLPLSVGDLINLMLQNNLDIGVNRLTPFSAQYLIETAYRPFEPTLTMQATVNRNTTASTTVLSGADNPSTLGGQYALGFSQMFETGTTLAVDLSMNRNSSNSSFSLLNPSWNGTVRYTFAQPLMRNFGRMVNTRPIRIAQNNRKISETQFERQLMDIVAQAQRTYWDLVFSAEDIKVKQRSMDLAQKTLSDNEIQVQIGTLAPIDVVQAKSEVANRRVQLITTTFTEAQTQDQVKKLITPQGDPGSVLARLAPTQGVRRPETADVLPVEEAIRVALENRPEMRQLQLDLQNKDIDIQYTKNQLLPTVDFIASYTQTGVAGTKAAPGGFFNNNTQVNPDLVGGIGTAFGQLFGYNYTGYSVGFQVQIPLRNRAAQADSARAAIEKQLAENRINATAQQIALEVRNTITQIEMQKARIDAAQTARELAEERLAAEQKKFDLGASTIRFVLEEQRNVAQTQTDELQSLVNYTKSIIDFDRAIGLTLKKNNIEVEKTLNPGATAK